MSSEFRPMVPDPTNAVSESVRTLLQQYDEKQIVIPDYQRDSDQWDIVKKSLFIESVLNNLTIPAFFLAPVEGSMYEVIDGQQRLTTLREYYFGNLRLADSDEADYLGNRAIAYAGKTYAELKDISKLYHQTFQNYLVTLIKLPRGVDDSSKREIFKRINEAGTPLSAQDIRLAYWGRNKAVQFIRLVGVYDPTREGSKRMIDNASSQYGLSWPWINRKPEEREAWKGWWNNKQTSIGQTASEMFLWYLVARYRMKMDQILGDSKFLSSALRMTFNGRTDEVADVFSAQLEYESKESSPLLCSYDELNQHLFPVFANWWYRIHINMPSVGVDRNRRIAFLIAAMADHDPTNITPVQWDLIESFLRSPRTMTHDANIDFPESKGKWHGKAAQKSQIEAFYKVASYILSQ